MTFKQPVSKAVCHVLPVCNSIIDSFNTFLQAEEPLIHRLDHSTLCLYCALLLRFILLEVISELDDVLSIDPEDPDVLKDSTVYSLEQ